MERITELVRLHLRFHTYGMGWTDSAVRRYVTDAGDLLAELNVLTRCDCTTRNERKAARLILQDDVGSIDYWNNSDKQRRTRSQIKQAITLSGLTQLKTNRERVAVEIMKLAKNRHDALLAGTSEVLK